MYPQTEDPRQIVADIARRYQVPLDVALSIWQQESGQSTDMGLQGPMTQYGQATGPWQMMPAFHGTHSTFPEQTDAAMRYLREGYDSFGQSWPHAVSFYQGGPDTAQWGPNNAQYRQEVLSRAPSVLGAFPRPAAEAAAENVAESDPDFLNAARDYVESFENSMRPFTNPWLQIGMGILGNVGMGMNDMAAIGRGASLGMDNMARAQQSIAANRLKLADLRRQIEKDRYIEVDDNLYDTLTRKWIQNPFAGVGGSALEFEDVQKLRKEYGGLTSVENMPTIAEAYNSLQSLGKSGTKADDLAILYKFMKALDPTSVVREGEAYMVKATGGLLGLMGSYVNQLQGSKEGTFDNATRTEIVNTAGRLYNEAVKSWQQERDYYTQLSNINRVDPFRVVGARDRFQPVTLGEILSPEASNPATAAPPPQQVIGPPAGQPKAAPWDRGQGVW